VPDAPPYDWAMAMRDGVTLMFQTAESLGEDIPAFRGAKPGGSLSFFVRVQDIDGFYERVWSRVEPVMDLRKTFYGMREFYFRDPNGYILGFAEDAADDDDDLGEDED